MIRVLVLGASGMLGSMVVPWLRRNPRLEVAFTARRPLNFLLPKGGQGAFFFDCRDDWVPHLYEILSAFEADYIVNCIGIINVDCRDQDLRGVLSAVQVNALFPQALAQALAASGRQTRVIHITTDCVYSGSTGGYDERSLADPLDFYGKSKLLGEVINESWLNIRCSVIGTDAARKRSFLEWVLSHAPGATVSGYRHHRWNGVTSLQYAQFCEDIIINNRFADLRVFRPTVHYAPNHAVTKYELVRCVSAVFARGLNVIPVDVPPPAIDRTLRSLYLPPPQTSIEEALIELREICASQQKVVP